MLAETLGVVIFIGLSLALNRLFEDVDRHRAQQLVALVLVSSALSLVGVVFSGAGFLVFRGGADFVAFDDHTRDAIGMLLIRMHGQAVGMTWFLAPDYTDALFRYFQPLFFAELAAMLWLLIMGAKEQPLAAAATT